MCASANVTKFLLFWHTLMLGNIQILIHHQPMIAVLLPRWSANYSRTGTWCPTRVIARSSKWQKTNNNNKTPLWSTQFTWMPYILLKTVTFPDVYEFAGLNVAFLIVVIIMCLKSLLHSLIQTLRCLQWVVSWDFRQLQSQDCEFSHV